MGKKSGFTSAEIEEIKRLYLQEGRSILQRYAVTSAAFSVPYTKASSDFGVGDAAVGESNAIANRFDLLSPIAFTHVFQLNCWPRRYRFCLCVFVA